jgi:hypothetical protein
MGLYADGHLVFGALVNDEVEDSPLFGDDGDVLDLAEVLALKAGHEDPWKEYYAAVERGEVDDRSHGGYDEWCAANPDWVARKEQWYQTKADLDKDVPVEIRSIGHYDGDESPTFVLLKDREYRGDTWKPTAITPPMLQVSDEEIREAIDFCAEHDLPFENPQWYLVASYG